MEAAQSPIRAKEQCMEGRLGRDMGFVVLGCVGTQEVYGGNGCLIYSSIRSRRPYTPSIKSRRIVAVGDSLSSWQSMSSLSLRMSWKCTEASRTDDWLCTKHVVVKTNHSLRMS